MPNEAQTRKDLIDPQLKKAGWDVDNGSQVGIEIPVDGFDPQAWEQLQGELKLIREQSGTFSADLPVGISDYVLFQPNGEIIAVVEAKKTSIDPRLAQAQTEFYVTEIEKRQSFRPFGFMANGKEIFFWDVGISPKRQVHGFFSSKDLEILKYIRENKTPLIEATVNLEITNRAYQLEAIQRVAEAFTQGKRQVLLTMATGTGKTRTAMSLVDVFLKSNQAQRILFVADRVPLVQQALDEGFKEHLPDEPATRIYTHKIEKTSRLYVSTLQTLNNCFRAFTPAFFDLIIFDEVHRSIFNKWNDVLQYFDGRMIGLTATPAGFIDRNTFTEFGCPDGIPTFLYSYKEAIDDGYLVDYDLYKARTRFQRKGIRGVDLSEEERNTLIDKGLDPDEIDFSGTELERKVSNRGTLREQWEEFWEVCRKDQSGQLPGKTIVFAMTQDHAVRLESVFEEMYPEHIGLTQVITHKSDYKGRAIEKFKKEEMPRIAISVDMLETGVNVPEVTNLVFMRPIQSRIKLEQMIGRGTRVHETCKMTQLLPNGHKDGFLIIDFWENDFNKPPEKEIAQSLPVLVSIFNTRLKLLEHFIDDQNTDAFKKTIADLRQMIGLIPLENFTVQKTMPLVERAWDNPFWAYVTHTDLEFLKLHVGPLLRFAAGTDVQAATFTSKVERLKLQILQGKDVAKSAQSVAEDVSRLPKFVYEAEPSRETLRDICLSPAIKTASPDELDEIIASLADQMRYRVREENAPLEIDLKDMIETRGYLILQNREQPIYYEEYRQQVNQRVLDLVAEHPTITAIERGDAVSDMQLLELERTLREELGKSDLALSEENIRKAYRLQVDSFLEFLRELLEIEGIPNYQEIVKRQFAGYIESQLFNAAQIGFLRAVQSVFLQKRHLRRADFYDPPLTSFGEDAVERLFSKEQINDVLSFAEKLVVF
ncbi:MAG: DEAD/DEAH box helicase family protein [Anaerolineae bacterium]|nr:DEAD/DEAH box helicase family protein [Anaerolineae bacterium]MBL6960639.1 DEAD/DEAH box helicase family protein [Anaerolineales bacterium]